MKRLQSIALFLTLVLLLAIPVQAQDDGYELDWWTADGGGLTDQDGASGYSLAGTIGQPDAALWTDSGYSLSGGFWFIGPAVAGYNVFLPVVVRGGP